MKRPSLPAPVALPTLTSEQVRDFERAQALLSAVVAGYSEKIANASDSPEGDLLRSKERFVRARRFLSAGDDEQVRKQIREAQDQLAGWDHAPGAD